MYWCISTCLNYHKVITTEGLVTERTHLTLMTLGTISTVMMTAVCYFIVRVFVVLKTKARFQPWTPSFLSTQRTISAALMVVATRFTTDGADCDRTDAARPKLSPLLTASTEGDISKNRVNDFRRQGQPSTQLFYRSHYN